MSNATRATLFAGVSFPHLDLDAAARQLLSPPAWRPPCHGGW